MAKAGVEQLGLKYQAQVPILREFFQTFEDRSIQEDPVYKQRAYLIQFQKVANREIKQVKVYVEDVRLFCMEKKADDISLDIMGNTKHYQKILLEIVDELIPQADVDYIETKVDIINRQRQTTADREKIPKEILRFYELVITHRPKSNTKIIPVRKVGAKHIGKLIQLQGIVTRVSDVQPMIQVSSYICDVCGYELFQSVGLESFQPIILCRSEQCISSNSKGRLNFWTGGSRYLEFQEIKVQEPNTQVPIGQVPRTITIKLFGSNTNIAAPGDQLQVVGVFLPTIYTGFQALRAGLLHDTYVEGFEIIKEKKSYRDTDLSEEMLYRIESERRSADIYTRLAESIAPEIHGMLDVKKALLLLLVGGATKQVADGVKIRGDINILLMGDPGVAKSQLLKHIAQLTPRGIYTTGKGSSGVGLTAALLKDPVSKELVLEGGALVLSDMGICCIDEFDKMDERDRTAIHEVMEQQTVSIAKAGITTSLKARTSILAAANPLYGRYNADKTPNENINLPPALLSRFDLVFLLLDNAEQTSDSLLAQHVTYVHMHGQHPPMSHEPLEAAYMRAYIAEAKRLEPIIPEELQQYIVGKYISKRNEQADIQKEGYVYVTPRTLIGIIRLSQGLARLRFGDVVERNDVDEALRLMEACRASVNNAQQKKRARNPMSQVWELIKDELENSRRKSVQIHVLRPKVVGRGISEDLMWQTINKYENLNVIVLSHDRDRITLIETS